MRVDVTCSDQIGGAKKGNQEENKRGRNVLAKIRVPCDQKDDGDGEHHAQDQVGQDVAHIENGGRREGCDVGGVQKKDEERRCGPLKQL